ncbi:MAG: FCD domain-containing protein, partial [Desulfuromonadales bacterium]|nr:FCD domain-containing protein [Desulfuromonadales bacterium]
RDARRFFARDGAFHDLLVQASGNQRLVEICQSLRRQMFLYRTESVFDPEAAGRLLADHRRIVEHLEQGDVTGIEAAIGDHLKHAKADIFRRVFEKSRAAGGG